MAQVNDAVPVKRNIRRGDEMNSQGALNTSATLIISSTVHPVWAAMAAIRFRPAHLSPVFGTDGYGTEES